MGQPETFGVEDLYPNARPSLDLLSDMVATSDDWGVSKPDPEFFRHVGGRGTV